jgi:hypothetical protein
VIKYLKSFQKISINLATKKFDRQMITTETKQYPNGTYTGEVNSESQRHGFGTFEWNSECKWKSGCKYSGQWSNDLQNGDGNLYWANGKNWYSGGWLDDKRHGEGCLYYGATGNIRYTGGFDED